MPRTHARTHTRAHTHTHTHTHVRTHARTQWERWRSEKDVSKRSYFAQLGSLAFYGMGHSIAEDSRTVTGGPLIYERLGKVDVAGILGDAEVKASVIEAYIMSLETAWRTVRACGGKYRATMVLDLKGLGWAFMSNTGFIKEIAKIGPPNYPEITEKIIAGELFVAFDGGGGGGGGGGGAVPVVVAGGGWWGGPLLLLASGRTRERALQRCCVACC
jgi:hypothetical protein